MNPTMTQRMTTFFAARLTPERRRSAAGSVVTAIYLALVVCAPLIIRYAPAADVLTMVASTQSANPTRCAAAPEIGLSCGNLNR